MQAGYEPLPTRLVLAIGAREAGLLRAPLEAQLARFGDVHHQIEVVVSPFPYDAHCTTGGGRPVPDEGFVRWAATVNERPPRDAFPVWVYRHVARPDVIQGLVRLAQDPRIRFLVLGDGASSLDYLGTNVDYLAAGPLKSTVDVEAAAFAIAEAVLFRFPTPTTEPMLPWALLARANYHPVANQAASPQPQGAAVAGPERDPLSVSNYWWGSDAQSVETAAANGRPNQAKATGGDGQGSWLKRRHAASKSGPPARGGVRDLIPSHVPLTIVVTAAKDGVGKTSTTLGLLLAAQEAAPAGMPILGIDSEVRQAGLANLVGVDDNQRSAVWDVILQHQRTGRFEEPAASQSGIYIYQQAKDIDTRALDSMFDADGQRRSGQYDLDAFMDSITRKYPIAVVDASSHRDVALLWAEVADAIVIVGDASPPTAAATQTLVGLYQIWRASAPERAQLPLICTWSSQYRATTEVSRRRRKIQGGFEVTLPGGEGRPVEGVPLIEVPRDPLVYSAADYLGVRRANAMRTYRQLFSRLVNSMGARRLRA